ncbi:Type II secretion system protein F [Caulifigura coniformis]|uniref:Type II secretion system protein F n=1 Tax=Caulifigura coniformis TaxID=2527983 RepID=A0A517SJF5_9PLAN|nr:type II secretion system F family protein [Caulifigura coniformis]QDT56258.1 Type II secretion system protein F [Caulifigura coniformis]
MIDSAQLTRLATELEILLRANSPLGPGLRDASNRWRGALRPAAEKLAERLDAGMPVDEALRTAGELPPVFRSLAAAGMTTDRAADVLRAYSTSTRQLLDLRERLLRGLMYPAIILILTYGLTILLIHSVLPQMASMVGEFSRVPPRWVHFVEKANATLPVWSWAIPLGLLVASWLVHFLFGRHRSAIGIWGSFPFVRSVLSDIHSSTASSLLAALLDCEVPLPLALSLAGESLTSRRAQAAVNAIADDLRKGVPAQHAFRERAGAPPLWRALFVREREAGPLRAGLRHIAEVLALRARSRADVLGRVIPVLLIIAVGGLTVGAYGTVVFGPLVELWERIGAQP